MSHRRLAVAAELRAAGRDDITDNVQIVEFGSGDEANAKRFRLAVASNLDAKPFTPEERKDIAEYVYGERDWTLVRIGQALNVSKSQVAKDLKGFPPSGKPNRPKGGRPKGSTKPRKSPNAPTPEQMEAYVLAARERLDQEAKAQADREAAAAAAEAKTQADREAAEAAARRSDEGARISSPGASEK
jgi:hypothetical protein